MMGFMQTLIVATILSGVSHAFADKKIENKALKGTKSAIVFFEIGTKDLDRAKSFYGDLFGWTFQDLGTEASLIQAQNMQGLLEKIPSHPGGESVVIYMQVEHIKNIFDQAISRGATQIIAPHAAPGRGSVAVIRDLDHNRIGIFSTEVTP